MGKEPAESNSSLWHRPCKRRGSPQIRDSQGNNVMFTSMFDSSTVPVLEQVVSFTQARHGVLAGNLANLDTPGYKTRDLSPDLFRERLGDAVEARRERQSGIQRAGGYPHAAKSNLQHSEFAKVHDAKKSILYHDQSDVSLETQVTEIAKNQAQHNMALSLMTAQFRLLRAAITERA